VRGSDQLGGGDLARLEHVREVLAGVSPHAGSLLSPCRLCISRGSLPKPGRLHIGGPSARRDLPRWVYRAFNLSGAGQAIPGSPRGGDRTSAREGTRDQATSLVRRQNLSTAGVQYLWWCSARLVAPGWAASLPISARAQQRTIPVIGWLHTLSGDRSAPVVAAFREALRGAGYVEGQNVAIEYRWADGEYERLAELAGIVRRGPRTARAPRVHAPRAG